MNIRDFNKMYGLPVGEFPGTRALLNGNFRLRLQQLQTILQNELDEITDVRLLAEAAGARSDGSYDTITDEEELDLLVGLADLMVDLMIYAESEMVKWGLPTEAIHAIIMQSNASKLMADGTAQVIDGKLQKGPNYWKPEPKIKALLRSLRAASSWNMPPDPAPAVTPAAGAV